MKKLGLLLLLSVIASSAFAEYTGFLWKRNQGRNNCYNYSLGLQNNNFQQPGDASGRRYEVLSCADQGNKIGVVTASINDGLRFTDDYRECKYDEQVVALVAGDNYDYHWYRLEGDGTWTHKPGATPATDLDHSGNIITDIMTADHGGYEEICGYFCVDYDHLKVQ